MLRIALALVFSSALVAGGARAQSPEPDPRALFQEGQVAYNAGEYEVALEKWQEAYDLSQRSALLYNIAQAYSRLGRVTKEKAALEAFIASDGGPEGLKVTAEERLRSLEQRIARTALRVEGDVAGAEVFIDGERVGTLPLTEKIAVAPGRHRIEAVAEGYVDSTATVVVSAGDTVPVELHFEPVEVVVKEGKKISPLAWGLWAGGGAALAGGAILGGLALGKSDGAVDGSSDADSARGMALGADIALAAGAAAVVAGVIVQILKKKKSPSDESPEVSLSPTRQGAALVLRKDF